MIPNGSCVTAPKKSPDDFARPAFDVSGAGTPLPLCQMICSKRSMPYDLLWRTCSPSPGHTPASIAGFHRLLSAK